MPINRRHFFQGFAASAVPAVLRPQALKSRHNILVIVSDDQGLHLGCYGDRVVQTPNLDRLAAGGVRFSHAFCTTASCSASRSVILTGLYNHANGQYGHGHLPDHFHTLPHVRSLPRLLRDRGYLTAIIGKLHVLPRSQYPFEVNHEGNQRDLAGMARKAGELFQRAKSEGKPFYLHIGYGDPHRAGRGFGNERSYPGVMQVKYDPERVEVPPFLPDQPEVRQEIAEYYQAISRLDQGVGMLLDELRKSGQDQDTLVIYISDNGMPFPGAKASLYEPGIRLPLIVRTPGLKRRGLVNHAMVNWADLVPACLEWAGAPAPDYPLQGRSFLRVLEQENPAGWEEIFFSHTFHEIVNYYPGRGIRTRRHKYIRNIIFDALYPLPTDLFASETWQGVLRRRDRTYGGRTVANFLRRPYEELYDLEKDPGEFHNVAASPEHAETLTALRQKVDEFQQKTADPWWGYLQQRRALLEAIQNAK